MIATAVPVFGGDHAPANYVVHEWGTFTSVQGSDGALVRWNPFTQSDLPDFVYSRQHPVRGAEFEEYAPVFQNYNLKSSGAWLQRMETPVLYFYAPEPIDVRVKVQFADGLLTEWYPAVNAFGPAHGVDNLVPSSDTSYLEWDRLSVEPRATATASRREPAVLVRASGVHHYYDARQTGSSLVKSRSQLLAAADRQAGQPEKFLFYRGAGNFSAPLNVRFAGSDSLLMENGGAEKLPLLFVYHCQEGQAGMLTVTELKPGETRALDLASFPASDHRESIVEQLSRQMRAGLESAQSEPLPSPSAALYQKASVVQAYLASKPSRVDLARQSEPSRR
jgi:hypothetical protein